MTLHVQNLDIHYGDTAVVRNFSQAFQTGKITALLGPNGAGKSSLLKCLAGIIPPRAGTLDRGSAQPVGYFEQGARCHWNMQVSDVVALGRLPFGDGNPEIIAQAMAATDTTSFAARRIHDLSGGEQSRVLLARVLAGTPAWILADEPLGHLDPAHQLDIMAVLRAQADKGTGVIIVMHDIALAARHADAVILLADGVCVARGAPHVALSQLNIAQVFSVRAEIREKDGRQSVEIIERL
jgi:iron complex transport system ATP-binding protein